MPKPPQPPREVLLIKADDGRFDDWRRAFDGFDVEVRDWDAPGDAARVNYALVWQPPPGALARLVNLKLIISIGAGLDHLLGENILPRDVPVLRMVEDGLTAGITEYVLYTTLRFHRAMPQYEADRLARRWRIGDAPSAQQRRIGILGLGVLGADAARALVALGFDVAGWSRGAKNIDGVVCLHGDAQLPKLLARSEILICLLPLTAATENILCAANFAKMPKGAHLINAARGAHCNEGDLIEALDCGQLAGAALDVFREEPLPPDNPLWRHPAVYITPHIAGKTMPHSAAQHVIENIRRLRAGRALTHQVNFARGY